MSSLGVLIAVVGVLIANIPAMRQQWRSDRPAVTQTIELVAAYFLYCGLGFALVVWILPYGGAGGTQEAKALQLGGILLGWIMYGVLTLIRVVPRYREPPRVLMRFGIADVIVLGILFGCLAAYVWI